MEFSFSIKVNVVRFKRISLADLEWFRWECLPLCRWKYLGTSVDENGVVFENFRPIGLLAGRAIELARKEGYLGKFDMKIF